jgi:putative glutamine amidotransferase
MSPPLIAVTGSLLDATGDRPERVTVNAAYLRAVEQAGGIPWLIPPGLEPEIIRTIIERCDGLMLTGGGDVAPARYGQADDGSHNVSETRDVMEFTALALALERQTPLLAICRGIQVLNVYFGGSLHQDLPRHRPSQVTHRQAEVRQQATHDVSIQRGTHLAAALSATTAATNSVHHQGIDRLADRLRAAAYTEDGLVEGVEIDGHPFALGVQWHPEELTLAQPHARQLFVSFTRAAADGRGR